MPEGIDILEKKILQDYGPEVFALLLKDQSMSLYKAEEHNIFWATHDYEWRGQGFEYHSEIRPELLVSEGNERVIMPRIAKRKQAQANRVKKMAEVFTPSWLCNLMNNVIDEKWFGRKDVFNVESPDHRSWQTTTDKVAFPDGKTWMDYVLHRRMEITCGEAPFITSRYDTTTGVEIAVNNRIGFLDRKLRVINENADDTAEWLDAARRAYQSTMAYEWQGDNLLLARENLLYTFIDNYEMKFGKRPARQSVKKIAEIISWNVWQMDGLKGVIPGTCHDVVTKNLMGEEVRSVCPGCKNNSFALHNGVPCLIMHWPSNDSCKTGEVYKYSDIRRAR